MSIELILDLDGEQRRQLLSAGCWLLGSGPDCDVQLALPTVSRRHARLQVAERLQITDLDSRNGSFVDDQALLPGQAWELVDGSALRLGRVRIGWRRLAAGDAALAVRLQQPFPPAAPAVAEAVAVAATLRGGPANGLPHAALLGLLRQARTQSCSALARAIGEALLRHLPLAGLRIGPAEAADQILWFCSGSLDEAEHARCGAVELRCRWRAGDLPGRALELAELTDALLQLSPQREARAQTEAEPCWPQPQPLDHRLRRLYRQAARVARSEVPVLIRGESGTGKELFARYIHDQGGQPDAPFVALNCAALPEDLLEAELFGVEKGVATGVDARAGVFERADGGTLFLDEIGDMAAATQARILRVLQEREVLRLGGSKPRPARARVLSATLRDLPAMVADGRFRADLWHRIADWEVELPPLRERGADLSNLAAWFLARAAAARGIGVRGISERAMQALAAYDWPGNVRELEREMQRAAVFLDDGAVLTAEDLRPAIRQAQSAGGSFSLASQLAQAEARIIDAALAACDGEVDAAAVRLGISRATLYRRLAAREGQR